MNGKTNLFVSRKGRKPERERQHPRKSVATKLHDAEFVRPLLRHTDPNILAEESLADLDQLGIAPSTVVIGISLGGLIAARYQEMTRPDLTVLCVSSPTWADGVRLERPMPLRAAFYSSKDEVIMGRTAEWPSLAKAWDIGTLTHDTDRHAELLARAIAAFLKGEDVSKAILG